MSHRIKVLIVDDSAVVRQVLSGIFASDPKLNVIGSAADPILAREKMNVEWPDVIILDIEMPRMDGITFLKQIMQERPTRIIICSTLTEEGSAITMQALAAGAVGYVTKPKLGLKGFLSESATEIINSIKQAALTTPRNFGRSGTAATDQTASSTTRPSSPASPLAPLTPLAPLSALQTGIAATPASRSSNKIVAIGTSTGGTQALEALLTTLPKICAGIVIVQHMPEKFTALFAERLNNMCAIEVREARDGDHVSIGRALIAPGGKHMRVVRSGAFFKVAIVDGPPVNRHKPSVDVLFKSVADITGNNALGIILTGMGDDGARGLREMYDADASTIAQDEESCVVFGMPKEAIRHGAVDRVVALDKISAEIQQFSQDL